MVHKSVLHVCVSLADRFIDFQTLEGKVRSSPSTWLGIRQWESATGLSLSLLFHEVPGSLNHENSPFTTWMPRVCLLRSVTSEQSPHPGTPPFSLEDCCLRETQGHLCTVAIRSSALIPTFWKRLPPTSGRAHGVYPFLLPRHGAGHLFLLWRFFFLLTFIGVELL